MLQVLIVVYNQAEPTQACLASVLAQLPADAGIVLLDNGSDMGQAKILCDIALASGGRVTLLRSDRNNGFAGAVNRLLDHALGNPEVNATLLLNNDVELCPGFFAALADAVTGDDLVAGRLLSLHDPSVVDSLGIVLYRSGLASNRKRGDERLLGPTGGCMLLSRRLCEDLRARYGYWFDERFFCYAEDTDLVLRARWLGYGCTFADDAVALHHGSLSSGGPDNEFVLYHGIRNSIWALVKNAPALWLLAHLPWIMAAHAGIWLRNLRKGRWRTLWRLYRDALRGLPAMWRERRVVRGNRQVPARAWWGWVEPSLYERDYLRRAWRELWRSGRRADR